MAACLAPGAAVLGGCAAAPVPAVTRAAAALDPFYRQIVDAGGVPVVGSEKVPAQAMEVARRVVEAMLAHRPDIRGALIADSALVAVIAEEEGTMDLPEYRGWTKPRRDDPRLTQCERDEYDTRIAPLTDAQYWNARTRGSGGNPISVGAENLLARPNTRYFGESILVHEFAHAMLAAVRRVDAPLYGRVEAAYSAARAAGKWKGDYAAVTVDEYWAEGTQFWFETNMISRLDDGTILSAEDLRRYDPALAAVLAEVYGPGHRIAADPFHRHMARLDVPLGRRSADC